MTNTKLVFGRQLRNERSFTVIRDGIHYRFVIYEYDAGRWLGNIQVNGEAIAYLGTPMPTHRDAAARLMELFRSMQR